MKLYREKNFWQVAVIVSAFICLVHDYVIAAPIPERVLVLPFSVNAAEDKPYLQNGARDILVGRLTVVDRLEVLTPAESTSQPVRYQQRQAQRAALEANADYAVYGTVSVFSGGISTDAFLLDARSDAILLTYNKIGGNEIELMSHLAELTEKILATLESHQPATTGATGQEASSASTAQPTAGKTVGLPSALEESPAINMVTAKAKIGVDVYWQSEPLQGTVAGVATGDFNGDRLEEIALLSKESLIVYSFRANTLVALAEYKGHEDTYFQVTAADINHNGLAELFVLSKPSGFGPFRTVVLEWDGSRLVKIHPDLPYAVYAGENSEAKNGTICYGQRLSTNNPLRRDQAVSRVVWEDNTYGLVDEKTLPATTSILTLAQADFTGQGEGGQLLEYGDDNMLRLVDKGTNTLWKSETSYGLTNLFHDSPPAPGAGHTGASRHYINQRPLAMDCNGDGRSDFVIANNSEAMGFLFKRSRSFTNGQLECLTWSHNTFRNIWKSDEFSGYFSSQAKGDINGDGQDELIGVNVPKESSLSEDNRSSVAVWFINGKSN